MDNFNTLASLVLSGAGDSLYEIDPRQGLTSQPVQGSKPKTSASVGREKSTQGSQFCIAA